MKKTNVAEWWARLARGERGGTFKTGSGRLKLENVWQLKDLQTRFSDVWQGKDLAARFL